MKSRAKKVWLVIASLLLVAAIWAFRQAGLWLADVEEAPEKADVIFALGGDIGDRVNKSVSLYRDGYAPRILLSGLENAPAVATRPYLNWREQFLVEAGVPLSAILVDTEAKNSWQEAANTLELMRRQNWKRVLVVSDAPHLRRLMWIWSRTFAGSGREFRVIAADRDRIDLAHWWRDERTCVFVATEWFKFAYYVLKY